MVLLLVLEQATVSLCFKIKKNTGMVRDMLTVFWDLNDGKLVDTYSDSILEIRQYLKCIASNK